MCFLVSFDCAPFCSPPFNFAICCVLASHVRQVRPSDLVLLLLAIRSGCVLCSGAASSSSHVVCYFVCCAAFNTRSLVWSRVFFWAAFNCAPFCFLSFNFAVCFVLESRVR